METKTADSFAISGVGKTTLTKKLVYLLTEKGVKTSGFYTEEIRRNGVREGFDVVGLNGARGRLARDQYLLDGPVKCRVGKYGILVQEFEKIALPCLEKVIYFYFDSYLTRDMSIVPMTRDY